MTSSKAKNPISDTETRPFTGTSSDATPPLVPALTVIAHRDPGRVGDLAVLAPLLTGKAVTLSRLEPVFAPRRGRPGSTQPLGDERLSRKGLRLTVDADGGVRIESVSPGQDVFVEGTALGAGRNVSPEELETGVTLLLSRSVCLLLHRLADLSLELALQDDGMIGESLAMQRTRQAVRRAAADDEPALIRGETGCGKELVAASIHRQSRRGQKLLSVVNLAAIPGEMAASTLFGSVRGAYTGATRRAGQFQSAHGTTLVLDEIGLAGPEVQQSLLRAIENREVRRVGATELETVDVRVVASTDRDLEAEIEHGRFLAPLLHRLETHRIWVAPLRKRRDDIGRLLYAFVGRRLDQLGRPDRLDPDPDGGSWIPAWLVERLVRHRGPGNVRELGNVARELVSHGLDDPRLSWTPELEARLTAPPLGGSPQLEVSSDPARPANPDPAPAAPQYRDVDGVTDEQLERAMAEADYVVAVAARRLGVRRTALIERIDRHDHLRLARDLAKPEIARAIARIGFSPDTLARHFRVGKKALKDRIRKLGLHPEDGHG